MGDGWGADPDMDLLSAGISKHLINLSARGCTDDGVIHGENPFASQQLLYRVQFDFYPEMPDSLFGFDERSSDVMISYHSEFEGDF